MLNSLLDITNSIKWRSIFGGCKKLIQLIMFIFRIMKALRIIRNFQVIQLIFCAILVSTKIYLWKCIGCPGFPDFYLCQPVTLSFFLNNTDNFNFSNNNNDFGRLFDLENFTFSMNVSPCTRQTLLILIHSAPYHFKERLNIRNMWGSIPDERFRLLFLIGFPNSTELQIDLNEESELHGDLVQGNFIDSYKNLTYKHVMGLKWTKYYCSRVNYLLKTDDDVFVNLPKFLSYLESQRPELPRKKLIRCLPIYNARACRSSRSKWKVSHSEYKFRTYPTYCQGYTILYSLDVVESLYALAQKAKYFWIDDVFVTGFLSMAAGFVPSSFGKFILNRENLIKVTDGNWDVAPYLIGPENLNSEEIKKLWKKVII